MLDGAIPLKLFDLFCDTTVSRLFYPSIVSGTAEGNVSAVKIAAEILKEFQSWELD